MKRSFFKKNIYLYHLLFWILFFAVWYFFRYEDFSTKTLAAKITLIKVIDLAIMVYFSNYILVPQFLYKKKYVLFGVCYVLLIICFSILKMKIEGLVMHNPAMFSTNFKGRIYDNVIPHFLLVSTGVAFKLVIDYAEAQKRIRDIAAERAAAELSFLKLQMNPHFMFNALNSVYFLIDPNNNEARNALHTFSEMLRYQLYETNGSKIPVEKEISFIQQYVSVQRLRKNDNLNMELHLSIANKQLLIEPLLLIPFIENAFKHVSRYSDGKKDFILISIEEKDNALNFKIENTTENLASNYINHQNGIGLHNVKRRLELLYPGKHTLNVECNNDWYKVNLSLSSV